MRKFFVSMTLAAAVVGSGALWAQAPGSGQAQGGARPAAAPLPPPGGSVPDAPGRGRGRGPQVPQGPTPRLPDGKPDFSGVWRPDNGLVGDISRILKPGDVISLKPEYEKLMKARKAGQDPEANCLPTGVPRMAPYPWTIASAPGKLFFLFEGNIHSFRQIFMDGRKHPDDPDPTWYGHSVGHWEGDTLVIETTKLKASFFGMTGAPYSDQMKLVERIRMVNKDALENEMTMTDPVALTKPWKVVQRYVRHPADYEIGEYICTENNHIGGGSYLDPKKWLPPSAFSATQ